MIKIGEDFDYSKISHAEPQKVLDIKPTLDPYQASKANLNHVNPVGLNTDDGNKSQLQKGESAQKKSIKRFAEASPPPSSPLLR